MQAAFLNLTSGLRMGIEDKYNKNELDSGCICIMGGRVVDLHLTVASDPHTSQSVENRQVWKHGQYLVHVISLKCQLMRASPCY
jgi:hypothetical protein